MDPSDVDIATLKSFKLHTQKSLLTYSPTNINSTLVIICVDENNQPIKIHQTNNNLENQNTIFEQDLNQLFSSSSDNSISFSPEAFHYLKDHKLTGGSKEFELKLILGIILYLTKKRVLVDSDKNFENLPKMIEIEDQMEQKEQNLNNNHNNHYDEYCSSPSIIIERNETEISSPGITSHIALPTAHILQGTPHSTKYQYQTLEQNRLPIFDGRASLKREKSSNSQNHQENLQMNMNHQVVGLSTERRKSIEFESFEPFRDRLIDVVGDVVSNGIVDGGEAEDEIFVF